MLQFSATNFLRKIWKLTANSPSPTHSFSLYLSSCIKTTCPPKSVIVLTAIPFFIEEDFSHYMLRIFFAELLKTLLAPHILLWVASLLVILVHCFLSPEINPSNCTQTYTQPAYPCPPLPFTLYVYIMCVQDLESTDEDLHKSSCLSHTNTNQLPNNYTFNSFLNAPMEDPTTPNSNSSPLGSICEETTSTLNENTNLPLEFLPILRSGDWSDIGGRDYMEDTHVCISDLAKDFDCKMVYDEAVSFYGVFDGHGGKAAAQFARDNLPRVIVEDADFPLELEKVVARSFVKTDSAFAKSCTVGSSLSSGTTALTAMIFGRSLLVANAGDSRAVLSRRGMALEMSKDHRPCCRIERTRVESLGGFVEDGYLNGQLGVTRALGDWHLEGMKHIDKKGGPLSAEPELKLVTLTKEDEFLIIGCDGIWDFFSNQNAVDFVRRQLQKHNDVKLCCKEVVEEAIKRGAMDNLTVVIVSFHLDPPPAIVRQKMKVRRSISAEGLQNLRLLLEG